MKRLYIPAFLLAAVLLVTAFAAASYASGPLDEIEDYEITVSPNSDGTLNMLYHIEWKVLDSDSEGPLSWVKVGIPNYHYSAINP